MKQLAKVEVKPLNDLDPWTEVTMYLFYEVLEPWARTPDSYWHVSAFLRRRLDWVGMILELMRKNEQVYLCFGEWRHIVYHPEKNDFSFDFCNPPIMDAERTCLIASQNITYKMWEAIRDLMEPIRFSQALVGRILGESQDDKVKSLLTFTKGDYKKICLKMEQSMYYVINLNCGKIGFSFMLLTRMRMICATLVKKRCDRPFTTVEMQTRPWIGDPVTVMVKGNVCGPIVNSLTWRRLNHVMSPRLCICPILYSELTFYY